MKLTVTELSKFEDTIYHWMVGIPSKDCTMKNLDAMVDWVKENNIPCSMAGWAFYFRNEVDTTMFLLRWG